MSRKYKNKIISTWLLLCLALPFQAIAADAPDPKTEIIYRTNLGRADDVRILLDKGVSTEQTDKDGVPLLALAATRQDDEGINVVKLLLDRGANINATDKRGQNALFYAARHDNKEIVDYLLEKGINYYAPDKDGYIARTIAYETGHQDIVQAMDDFVKTQTDKVRAQYEENNRIIMERYKELEKPPVKPEPEPESKPPSQPPAAVETPIETPKPALPLPPAPVVQPLAPVKAEPAKPEAETLAPAEPETPPELSPEEKAAKEAENKQQVAEVKKLASQLSFHYCAYQYWYFCRSSKQRTELSNDELNMSIDSHADAINDLIDQINDNYHVDPKLTTTIGDSAKIRIFNELNGMESKTERHEKGVGKMDDMQARCGEISREWDIAPPASAAGKGKPGGSGGIGQVPRKGL